MNNIDETIWERAQRMAFWDQGKMNHTQWLSAIKTGEESTRLRSINQMRASDFISLLDRSFFIKSWPLWRDMQGINADKRIILDGAWGFYVVREPSFPVSAIVSGYPAKKLATLHALANSAGQDNIYQIAKAMHRNYRRVYDDIMALVADGIAVISTETRHGRVSKIPRLRGVHVG